MYSHIGHIISEEAVPRRGNCDLPKVMQEDKQRAVQNKEDFGVRHICLESHEQVRQCPEFPESNRGSSASPSELV